MVEIFFWLYIALNAGVALYIIWWVAVKPLIPSLIAWLMEKKSVSLHEQKPQISVRQAAFLAITLVISTSDVFLPGFVAQDGGRDSWLSIILSGIFIMILLAIVLWLLKAFPESDIIDIFKKYLNPIVASVLIFLWFFFLLMKAFLSFRELGEVLIHAFLSDTPLMVLIGTALVLSSYAAKKGLQAITAANDFLLLIGIFVLTFVIYTLFGKADFKEYLPIMENGMKQVVRGAIPTLVWLTDVILVLFAAHPYIPDKKRLSVSFYLSTGFLIVALESGTLAIAIFGVSQAQSLIFPALEMVRSIVIERFFERMEVILINIWISGIFIKIAFLHYLLTLTLKNWFNLQARSVLVIPLAFMIFGFCMEPFRDMAYFLDCLHKIMPYYMTSVYLLMILALAIAFIRKKIIVHQTTSQKISSQG